MIGPRRWDGRGFRRVGYGLFPVLMLGVLVAGRPARPLVPLPIGPVVSIPMDRPVLAETAARAAIEPRGIDPGMVIRRSAEIDPRFVVERSAEIDPQFVISAPAPGTYVFVPEGQPRDGQLARARNRPARR